MDPAHGGAPAGTARDPRSGAGGRGEAAWQAQPRSGTPAAAAVLQQVTFGDVAVSFSAAEWSLLDGWQKELHSQVMLENYALLLSLGPSAPSAEFSSSVGPLEGCAEGWGLGRAGRPPPAAGGEDGGGDQPPFPPRDPEDTDEKEEGCSTPSSEGDGAHQSSYHLCALVRLVEEIPEFLYGHTKAGADPAALPGCCEAEGAAEAPRDSARMELPQGLRLHGTPANDLLSLSSRPDTPASSTEEDWVVPHIRDVATSPEVALEETPAEARLKSEKEAGPARPCQPRLQSSSPQAGAAAEAHSLKAAGAGDPGPPPRPCSRKEGEAGWAGPLGSGGSGPSSRSRSAGEGKGPETTRGEACREEEPSSPPLAREAAAEEKPLRGLLKGLKELIVHQPRRLHPASRKPSAGGWQQAPGRRRRDLGSPPIRVKMEAAAEPPPAPSPASSSPDGLGPRRTSVLRGAGGRESGTPERKDRGLFAAVKMELMTSSPPLGYLDRPGNSASPFGAAAARSDDGPRSLGVRIKMEAAEEEEEEELPPRGPKGSPKEQRLPQPGLANSGSTCVSPEAGLDLGLWAPYPEERSPGTSPLHGLLNCLRDIPAPRPHASGPPPAKRAAAAVAGGAERRKGGRRGTLGARATLQDLERCLKAFPAGAPSQACSPAVSSSIGSSPDRLSRWTPERGKWTRQEEGRSGDSTPLQGLERCLKELPLSGPSQPGSPAISSSISSSPDGPHRWTPEPGRRARKEGGAGRNSTPLPGSDRPQEGLPGSVGNRYFLPAAERPCKAGGGAWPAKEEGASSSRIPPLQGLENCLREIPVGRSPVPGAAAGARELHAQALRRTKRGPPGPWPGGDSTDRLLRGPASLSGSVSTEDGTESSPLHRLMNCLKEIPIRRPSYLNTPSASSSSSSCSETETDRRSPGSGAWWDCGPDTGQGSEAEEAAGQKAAPPGRRRGPLLCLLPEEGRRVPAAPEPPLAPGGGREPPPSPLRGLENCLKDIAVGRLPCSRAPAIDAGTLRGAAPRGAGVAVAGLHSAAQRQGAASGPHLPGTVRKPPAGSPPLSKSLSSDAQSSSEQREWDAQTSASSMEGEGPAGGSPLQGLLRCLKEITARGPSPCSSSASTTQGESRHSHAEGESGPGRASQDGAAPSGTPAWGPGSSPGGSGPGGPFACRLPALQLGPLRRSDSGSPRSSMKQALATAAANDRLDAGAASWSCQSRDEAEPGNLRKKRCRGLDQAPPLLSWAGGRPLDCGAELGDLGPALAARLECLSADMAAVCRDVSRLQSHLDRLEQDARGWVLELAALRMENRSLSEYVRRMEGRCRTLENRSRRNNLRLLGLPEGAEGADAVSFLQRTLPAMLGSTSEAAPLEIESARRVHGGVSWDAKRRPRPLLFRLLRFADKAALLQAARAHPLSYGGVPITILPDFYSSLAQCRRVPFRPPRRARWVADLCFASRHPSCCYGWAQGLREPLAGAGPLVGEKAGRAARGPGPGPWNMDPLPGPGCHEEAVLQEATSNAGRDAAAPQN